MNNLRLNIGPKDIVAINAHGDLRVVQEGSKLNGICLIAVVVGGDVSDDYVSNEILTRTAKSVEIVRLTNCTHVQTL